MDGVVGVDVVPVSVVLEGDGAAEHAGLRQVIAAHMDCWQRRGGSVLFENTVTSITYYFLTLSP